MIVINGVIRYKLKALQMTILKKKVAGVTTNRYLREFMGPYL